jgi:hypothetical protein
VVHALPLTWATKQTQAATPSYASRWRKIRNIRFKINNNKQIWLNRKTPYLDLKQSITDLVFKVSISIFLQFLYYLHQINLLRMQVPQEV